jgi:hypothetical protein
LLPGISCLVHENELIRTGPPAPQPSRELNVHVEPHGILREAIGPGFHELAIRLEAYRVWRVVEAVLVEAGEIEGELHGLGVGLRAVGVGGEHDAV